LISGPQACKLAREELYDLSYFTGPVLCLVFSKWGLVNYLPWLALNLNLPDLCLLSSWDYRREPPVPRPGEALETNVQVPLASLGRFWGRIYLQVHLVFGKSSSGGYGAEVSSCWLLVRVALSPVATLWFFSMTSSSSRPLMVDQTSVTLQSLWLSLLLPARENTLLLYFYF
jgi:hypothetical protein